MVIRCNSDINLSLTININTIIDLYLVEVGLLVGHCAPAESQIASIDDPGIAGDSDLRWKNIDIFKKKNEMKL